jgi:hypothetical protein
MSTLCAEVVFIGLICYAFHLLILRFEDPLYVNHLEQGPMHFVILLQSEILKLQGSMMLQN